MILNYSIHTGTCTRCNTKNVPAYVELTDTNGWISALFNEKISKVSKYIEAEKKGILEGSKDFSVYQFSNGIYLNLIGCVDDTELIPTNIFILALSTNVLQMRVSVCEDGNHFVVENKFRQCLMELVNMSFNMTLSAIDHTYNGTVVVDDKHIQSVLTYN